MGLQTDEPCVGQSSEKLSAMIPCPAAFDVLESTVDREPGIRGRPEDGKGWAGEFCLYGRPARNGSHLDFRIGVAINSSRHDRYAMQTEMGRNYWDNHVISRREPGMSARQLDGFHLRLHVHSPPWVGQLYMYFFLPCCCPANDAT